MGMYGSTYSVTMKANRDKNIIHDFNAYCNQNLMVGHGGSSAASYLADPTSPIPSHCAVIVCYLSTRQPVTYDDVRELDRSHVAVHELHNTLGGRACRC